MREMYIVSCAHVDCGLIAIWEKKNVDKVQYEEKKGCFGLCCTQYIDLSSWYISNTQNETKLLLSLSHNIAT